MSNRARRRAERQRLAQLRDGGRFDPAPQHGAPDARRAHATMKPALVHATKTSAAIRTRQILQVCAMPDGSFPRGKRRTRYTTTVCWNGTRAAGPNTGETDGQYHGVKILPPGK